MAGLHHEKVGLRPRAVHPALLKPLDGIVAHAAYVRFALGHQVRLVEARQRGRDRGHRNLVAALPGDFCQRLGVPYDKSASDPGHAVDLGERAGDQKVCVVLDEIDHGRLIREVDIRLVHHYHRVARFRLQRLDNGLPRGDGTGGVIRVAYIYEASVGIASHLLDIMRAIAQERYLMDGGAHALRHLQRLLVARVRDHQRLVRGGKHLRGQLEDPARARIEFQILRREIERRGQLLLEFRVQVISIASRLGNHLHHGFPGCLAGTEGVLVVINISFVPREWNRLHLHLDRRALPAGGAVTEVGELRLGIRVGLIPRIKRGEKAGAAAIDREVAIFDRQGRSTGEADGNGLEARTKRHVIPRGFCPRIVFVNDFA